MGLRKSSLTNLSTNKTEAVLYALALLDDALGHPTSTTITRPEKSEGSFAGIVTIEWWVGTETKVSYGGRLTTSGDHLRDYLSLRRRNGGVVSDSQDIVD